MKRKLRSNTKIKRRLTLHNSSDEDDISLGADTENEFKPDLNSDDDVEESSEIDQAANKVRKRVTMSSSDESVVDLTGSLSDDNDTSSGSDLSDFVVQNSQNETDNLLLQEWTGIISNLRNDNSLQIASFNDISRLYIMDILNKSTIKQMLTSTDTEFDPTYRLALNKLTKNLDEAKTNCQSGAWQHLLLRRLKIHPNLDYPPITPSKQKCGLCGRQRIVQNMIFCPVLSMMRKASK